MLKVKRFIPISIAAIFILVLATNAPAQQPNPTSAVATVEVTASVKEAEVGQQVKLTVVAKDASGNVLKQEPSTFFAGPFDIAAADDSGNVKLFGAGEVTAGALVGGKPGFTTFKVKPATIKTIEINAIKSPIAVGSTMQLEAATRIFSGDPRTGVTISWTSNKPSVATVDAGGVVTGIGPGTATIKATAEGASGTTALTVVKSNLRSLAIEPRSTSARTGDVVHFTAKGSPSSGFTPQSEERRVGKECRFRSTPYR